MFSDEDNGSISSRSAQQNPSPTGVNFTNILRALFAQIFLHQKIQALNISTKMLRKTFVRKSWALLVKLTLDVNFTNILWAAFSMRQFNAHHLCSWHLALYIFGIRKFSEKLFLKCWWNWLQFNPFWCQKNRSNEES